MTKVKFGWSPEATETFRWTSNKHPQGSGFNGQTDPKGFRFFKVVEEGRVFGQKDLKQAEARIVAYLAGARRLITLFGDPDANLYIEQGKLVFEREINKKSTWYTLIKSVIHASHYMEGPFKMAWDTGLSVQDARKFQENYHAANPEIRQNFHLGTRGEIVTKGYLTVPYFNRKRVFYEALGFFALHNTITDRQLKDAVAWRPQTLVPLILTRGMIRARAELSSEVWFHLHGHDSVIWSCPPEMFADAERVLDKHLDLDIPINGMVLNIPRETTVGYSVGDLMDYEGRVPTKTQWEKWRATEYKDRNAAILKSIYGPHIER
jgi:hypothetical protein